MKNNLLLCLIVFLSYSGGGNMLAQTLIPPTLPEYILPAAPGGATVITNTDHVSNYHKLRIPTINFSNATSAINNNLYVWAWGAINAGDFPCSDINGKVLYTYTGDGSNINKELNTAVQPLPNGNYYLKYYHTQDYIMKVTKITKIK